jgi:protein O-GlcNAc transferase
MPSSQTGGGSFADRLPELEKAVESNPTDRTALLHLGIGYYQANEYARAETTYTQLLHIEDSAETRNNLGNVYRDWRRPEQATEQYRLAIQLDPAFATPYANLAALYVMTGDIEKARAAAETGIGKTSGSAQQQLQTLLNSLNSQ